MAITETTGELSVISDSGRTFFQQARDQLRQVMARRKAYHTTLRELSSLSDRDLSDLGIPRSNIKRIALEAANDC